MKKDRFSLPAVLVACVILAGLTAYAYLFVPEYMFDGIAMIVLLLLLLSGRGVLHVHPWTSISISSSFVLHQLGVFGFYNISPLAPVSWDIVTHLVWGFSAMLFIFNVVHPYLFISETRSVRLMVYLILVAGAMGFTNIVEFVEFAGYFTVGEGMGVLGHGEGDTNTVLGNSEWFNTIQDLAMNTLGGLIGLGVVLHHRKRMRLPIKVIPIEKIQSS